MIIRNIKVPTGNICVMKGEKGLLEFLAIGDYGKDSNIKADFLGITRELNGVPNGEIMPLSEKMVITISTQYGCPNHEGFPDEESAMEYLESIGETLESLKYEDWMEVVCESSTNHVSGSFYTDINGNLFSGYPC